MGKCVPGVLEKKIWYATVVRYKAIVSLVLVYYRKMYSTCLYSVKGFAHQKNDMVRYSSKI